MPRPKAKRCPSCSKLSGKALELWGYCARCALRHGLRQADVTETAMAVSSARDGARLALAAGVEPKFVAEAFRAGRARVLKSQDPDDYASALWDLTAGLEREHIIELCRQLP